MELWTLAQKAEERLKFSMPVMFRRGAFNPAGNYSGTPKWHRLQAVTHTKRFDYEFLALCGYSHSFEGALGQKPEIRNEVKTKKLRCVKCDAAYAKAQRERAI